MFSICVHGTTKMEATKSGLTTWLNIKGPEGQISAFMPHHVARVTAAAFNRAMQITEAGCGGLVYATEAGDWLITQDAAMGTVWLAQHEDVTGDNDPAWMTASAHSLEALQDEIDDLVKDNACGECRAMAGLDEMIELASGREMHLLCADCVKGSGEREAEMHEAAMDDMAHALREGTA